MKLKGILLTAASCVLTAAIAVGGTLAYLQSDDSDVNVMTTGSVKIAQHEYERVVDANGNYTTIDVNGNTSYELKEFEQGKALMPATELDANGNPYNYGAGDYDSTLVKMSQVGSHGSMQVFLNPNAVDKFVTVENTGKSDAYVRTLIAFEIGDMTEARFDEVIGMSSFMTTDGVWTVTDIGSVKIGDSKYFVCEYVYNGAKHVGGVHEKGVLPAGDTTYPSLAQVYMKSVATNEDVEALDGNDNGTYDILVLSQAVQVAGFENAKTALDTAFGKTADKAAEWFGGIVTVDGASAVEFTAAPADAVKIQGNDKAAVLTAIESAKPGDTIALTDDTTIAGYDRDKKLIIDKDITLDLNGKTLTTECGWGGIDLKGGASIVNGTINHTGNTAAIKAFNVGKIENVVINVTETAGKTKGGIVVQNSGGSYVGSIKNVVINGATNGIETYNCGDLGRDVIGSMENVTINSIDTGILLSAPIGTVTNCTIKGAKIGVNAYLKGAYSVTANLVNCIVEGANADIYAHDEVGLTNPGSMNLTYDAVMALNLNIVREIETEATDRIFVGIK